jgi:ketosteroid isomerase-like protein
MKVDWLRIHLTKKGNIMRLYVAIAFSALLSASIAQAGHHEMGEAKDSAVIGTVFSKEQQPKDMVVGDLSHQQIWVDYIKAHNDRDLDKISDINADDWTGYVPDGSVVKGNAAHIEWLADWFASPDDPRWTIQWMIANSEVNDKGEVEQWLTTRNDITFNDAEGNRITEHHVHDIQFVGGKIKKIYVYARPAPGE